MKYKLSPVTITDKQRQWLEDEKERTGNSYTVIIRNLINDKIKEIEEWEK